MKAMIFAAGLGTRLRPLTDSMPKALVPVCGKSLIDHVAGRLVSAGADSLVINVHHFADMLEAHVRNLGNYGVKVDFSDERDFLLDTGGGVMKARPYLEGAGNFLVHNVDIISDLDIGQFACSMREDALASLVVSERKSSRYLLFDTQQRLVGWQNELTGEVKGPFRDLDPEQCRKLAFSGIHMMSGRIFDVMEEAGFSGKFSVIDFYLSVADRYPIYAYLQEGLTVVDAGKPETIGKAELLIGKQI